MLNSMNETGCRAIAASRPWRRSVCAWAIWGLVSVAAAGQSSFVTPQAGANALAEAVRTDDPQALRAILGPHGSKLLYSGDPVADARHRETFVQAFGEANKIVAQGPRRAQLWVSEQGWPLPIPLLQSSDGNWRFDTRSGEREVLSRRIGRNELAAIQVCLAVVDAQREYSRRDPDADGLLEYASRFTSTAGQRDGLYWPTEPDEAPSPLGPLLAAAAAQGYLRPGAGSAQPYQGYFYRSLSRQGAQASGGAYDYFVQGQMIAGFALVAYPARYGASGLMSFIVNQDGVVYQKNLGRNTAVLAARMATFNPDASWKKVSE